MSRPEILFRLQEEMRAAQRGDAETSKKEQIEGLTFYLTLVYRIRLNTSRLPLRDVPHVKNSL